MKQQPTYPQSFRNFTKHLVAGVLAVGLLWGASHAYAAGTLNWTNTAATGIWQDSLAWTTNGGSTGVSPGAGDTAQFTNNGTYYVTMTADVINASEVIFINPARTSPTVTLDLGGNTLGVSLVGNAPAAFEVCDTSSSTATVYLASSTGAGKGLFLTNNANSRLLVGRNGLGRLYITNGNIFASATAVANGSSASNSFMVISGPNTYYTNSATFAVPNNGTAKNCSLTISNSASLTVVGQFGIGGNSSLGASLNTLLLDSGGRLFTRAQVNLGNSTGTNNTATVQGGASWDLGGQTLPIGISGAGNSLTIGATSSVVNASYVAIASGNSLILTGGLLQVANIVTNTSGLIQGFGTIAGSALFTGSGSLSLGFGTSVGTLVLSNNLTLASTSTTTLKLDKGQTGSNDLLNVVGTLAEAGTLTINNVGAGLVGGDTFHILSFGGVSGSFSPVTLPSLTPPLIWNTSQLGSQGIISVVLPPSITGPSSQAVLTNTDVTISAVVTGAPAPGLQWQLNGVNLTNGATGNGSTISGSTSATLLVSNAQTNDSGQYCLIASNVGGAVTNCMTLTVVTNFAPPIIDGPADLNVILGQNGTFTASVAGIPTPTQQWQQNGVDIPGATGLSVTVTNVQFSEDGFVYSIIASNVVGLATNSAVLHVVVPPVIAVQPVSLVVTTTQSASFSVLSTNGVPAPTYQWYFNNGLITDATNATYTIASAAPGNAGAYHVIVANVAGSVTSTDATLTVNSTMAAALTPANGAVNVCYDTPLYMAFDRIPVSTGAGKVRIYNATNNVTPVDTIDTAGGALQPRTIATETFNTFPVIITGNTVAIYPHLGVLSSNQAYYVTVDPGTFAETNGALFAGVTSPSGWAFTTKPTGPANPNNVVVAADGSGDFCTVQGAVDSLPGGNTTYTLVNIRNGTYTEIVDTRNKNHITFRGQDRRQTVVRYTNNNNQNGNTHSRMSFKVFGNDIAIENLTLTNSTPKGGTQAEALMIESGVKRFILNNAEVDSFQDTILGNTSDTQAYFNNSLVQGDTDFIWGGMVAFFTNCEIRCLSTQSHITQARTDAVSNGIDFVNCLLTRASGSVSNCDLGRDGGSGFPFGNVAYISCSMDAHITPAGWIDNGAASSGTLRLWEYNSTDLTGTNLINISQRASWSLQLTNGDARLIMASSATNWLYGWSPQLSPNILTNPVSMTVSAGVSAVFSVAATGIPDPLYQWLKDGNPILGATSATFTNAGVVASDAGGYSVIVSNAAGTVTSTVATLSVVGTGPTASFTASPTSGTEPLGVTFTDTSSGSTNLTLFWDLGDTTALTNAGGASFVHTYAAGTYTVTLTASNAFGANSTIVSNNCITVLTAFQAWQLSHFGCTNNCPQAVASADPDGDGQNNLAEFLAGTDPNSAGSALRISSVVRQGDDVSITWTTAGGHTNVVQWSAGDVNGGYTTNFADLSGSIIIPGSGDVTNNYVDGGGATNSPSRYYRIRLAP